MTARHYESLVKKLTVDDVVIDRRVGGLKVIATAGR
jgi:hypothetical protein